MEERLATVRDAAVDLAAAREHLMEAARDAIDAGASSFDVGALIMHAAQTPIVLVANPPAPA